MLENVGSLIVSQETILNDSLLKISRLWLELTLIVTHWMTQIYLLFFTNVIQWTCLSHYAIPSNVQLMLDALYNVTSPLIEPLDDHYTKQYSVFKEDMNWIFWYQWKCMRTWLNAIDRFLISYLVPDIWTFKELKHDTQNWLTANNNNSQNCHLIRFACRSVS